jgi:peptidoglycan/LPS O-acetylase OafA/YrhL
MVVLFHENAALMEKAAGPAGLLQQFMSTWSTGVTIFFVLSGLLISLRYGDSVQLTPGWLHRYFQNRFARIYPIYFLLTTVALLLINFVPSTAHATYNALDRLIAIPLNVTLLRGYFQSFFFYFGVAPAWSLTVEETFYLLAPFMLLSLRRSWLPLLGYLALFTAAGVGAVHLFQGKPLGFFGDLHYMQTYTFFGRCFEFLVGMGLGWVFKRIPTSKRYAFTLVSGLEFVLGDLAIRFRDGRTA